MSDIRPIRSRSVFGLKSVSKRNNEIKKNEDSLIEALLEDEASFERKNRINKAKRSANREKQLEIKKEAGSFNDIGLDRIITERKLSKKTISRKPSNEYLQKKFLAEKRVEDLRLREERILQRELVLKKQKIELRRQQKELEEEAQEKIFAIKREREERLKQAEIVRLRTIKLHKDLVLKRKQKFEARQLAILKKKKAQEEQEKIIRVEKERRKIALKKEQKRLVLEIQEKKARQEEAFRQEEARKAEMVRRENFRLAQIEEEKKQETQKRIIEKQAERKRLIEEELANKLFEKQKELELRQKLKKEAQERVLIREARIKQKQKELEARMIRQQEIRNKQELEAKIKKEQELEEQQKLEVQMTKERELRRKQELEDHKIVLIQKEKELIEQQKQRLLFKKRQEQRELEARIKKAKKEEEIQQEKIRQQKIEKLEIARKKELLQQKLILEAKKNKQEQERKERLLKKEQEKKRLITKREEARRVKILKKSREIELKKALRLEFEEKKKEDGEKKREIQLQRKKEREAKLSQIKSNLLAKPSQAKNNFSFLRPALAFSGLALTIFVSIFSLRFLFYGIQIKDNVVVKGASVVAELNQAKSNFQDKNFSQVVADFENIQQEINSINQSLEDMEGGLPGIVGKLPFISKYSSAKNFLEAGNEIAKAMILIGQLVEDFSKLENPLDLKNNSQDSSSGDFFLELEDGLLLAERQLQSAQERLDEVDPNGLPQEYRERVIFLKDSFPKALSLLSELNQKQFIFRDLLGYNGHRKYLFLFQNNHEARATGGFIGSYGVLNVHDGNVKELFVDGIFNPDGQLRTKIVPPKPIQKISTNWSTHDANWFPDFPTSAKKIAWFYEKTGGPTVDGIITLTPTVMEKLLKITGPIEMPEYGMTINSENFIQSVQQEVEEDYDREENRPKKIIADLTPLILDKIFSKEGLSQLPVSIKTITEALDEKHILIYSENSETQKMVSDLGWSGEVLKTPKDYLMVVNSNINGYKTDGVIDQEIDHKIEIDSDGAIFDTVTIKRTHNGGSFDYEWWNKVNANYMRVYVPQGSELIEASGYTREKVSPPVDYDKLGFERDPLILELEKTIQIDEESGTEIWNENGKTVFGNWVYVSPQETVELSYQYKLPFGLDLNREKAKMDNYSVLYQKQSGMNTTVLNSKIEISDGQDIFWQYPEELDIQSKTIEYRSNLEKDKFIGVVIK